MEEFKRRNVGTMPGQGGDFYAKLNEVNAALEQAKMELDELANRKKQLEQQLGDQEETLTGPAPVTPTTTALDGRIAALQQQVDTLRLRYTDMHPDIARVKTLIARLEEQKKQEEEGAKKQSPGAQKSQNPIYQQLTIAISEAGANYASLKSRVAQLQARKAALYQSIDRIPQLEAEFTAMTRDYEVYKSNYAQFLQRRETANISGDVESKTDVVDFRVIDPPRVPNAPAWPNRPLFVSIAPLAGLGAGIAIAFLLGQIRPTVDSRRQLKEMTGLPLLGVVTRTQNEGILLRARRHGYVFFLLTAMLVVAYLGQLIYYLFLSPAA